MRIDCNTHKEALCINDNFCDVLHVSTKFYLSYYGLDIACQWTFMRLPLMMRQTNSQFNFFFRLRHRFEIKFVSIISLQMDLLVSIFVGINFNHVSNIVHVNYCLEYLDKS